MASLAQYIKHLIQVVSAGYHTSHIFKCRYLEKINRGIPLNKDLYTSP